MKSISEHVHRANRFERRLAVVRYLRKKFPYIKYVLTIDEYEYLNI